jgi:aminoglycoside phosphotransferase
MPPNSSQYHNCPRLHSLSAPLVRAGVKAKVEAVEREDYLRNETQATGDNGVVYMAIHTTRDEGDDLVVHPGVARVRAGFDSVG